MVALPRTLPILLFAGASACAGLHRPEPRALEAAPLTRTGESVPPGLQDEAFFAALERARRPRWDIGQVLWQGFIGVGYPQGVTLEDGGDSVEIDEDELDNLPVIGGGAQWKLAGERLDFGLETMMSFAFRSDLEAFAVGGGGATVVLDVDVLVFELFAGPFVSKLFGDRVRLYAGAGPTLQYVEFSQHDEAGNLEEDGSGSGVGAYARTGMEFLLPSGTLAGFGVRYSSTEVDLGAGLGDFELEGVQAVFTLSRGSP